jgi:hypothetical protein
VVITIDGNDGRLQRLIESLPFDPALLRIDRYPRGADCRSGQPSDNHHLIVGNRHKRIIEQARRRGLKNVFVFEDDVEITPGQWAGLKRALQWAGTHEDQWDIFYLGFIAPLPSRCAFVTRDVVRPSRPRGAHALCYSSRVYDDILSIDFSADFRPLAFRAIERLFSPRGRDNPYHRHGVGALDNWLSESSLRRVAAHPVLAAQTQLPPDTQRDWQRLSGRKYDVHATPRQMVRIALALHYALWLLGSAAVAGVAFAAFT